MTKIHFLKDFDYAQDAYHTIAYKAGDECYVDDECAAIAIARGVAVDSDIAEDDLFQGRSEDEDENEDA